MLTYRILCRSLKRPYSREAQIQHIQMASNKRVSRVTDANALFVSQTKDRELHLKEIFAHSAKTTPEKNPALQDDSQQIPREMEHELSIEATPSSKKKTEKDEIIEKYYLDLAQKDYVQDNSIKIQIDESRPLPAYEHQVCLSGHFV